MKPKVMFIIAAVYGLLVGLPSIVAPQAMESMVNLQLSPTMLMMVRFLGIAEFGLGLIAWLVRNAEASKTRNALLLGYTIYFALHALTSLYGQFTDTEVHVHWVMVIVQGFIAIGFIAASGSKIPKTES
ncbi:MAG TPA: hypothetical protein VLS85_09750 [Hanamia sp.]|nr:hypothetical protein [Hanamia sp.]